MRSSGFSLVELLVVITVIAVLSGVVLTNLQDARTRANDTRKKAELNQLKSALRLYYNDYNKYPDQETVSLLKTKIYGCGADGTESCPKAGCSADFVAGSSTCGDTIYMKKLPSYSGTSVYYYQIAGGDDFRLTVDLENTSDPNISANQARCPAAGGASYNSKTYVLCAD